MVIKPVLKVLKPVGQPQPIWREAGEQLELDLRIKCPVTGEMKRATPQLSHIAYRMEQQVANICRVVDQQVGAYQAWQMMVDRESR